MKHKSKPEDVIFTTGDKSSIYLGDDRKQIAYRISFEKSSWNYLLRFIVGWVLTPILAILSKLLKRPIEI